MAKPYLVGQRGKLPVLDGRTKQRVSDIDTISFDPDDDIKCPNPICGFEIPVSLDLKDWVNRGTECGLFDNPKGKREFIRVMTRIVKCPTCSRDVQLRWQKPCETLDSNTERFK
jgi:hypothetical protein